MILQDANEAAQAFLDATVRLHHTEEVVIMGCERLPGAWVFGYNTRRWVETSDLMASLVGNGPVVVPLDGGPPYLAGSATPVGDQLREG